MREPRRFEQRIWKWLRRRRQDYRIEQISTARNRFDQIVTVVAELVTEFPNALRDRAVRHDNVGPNGFVNLVLAHQPTGILCKAAQHLKGLRPQLDIDTSHAQASARQIEDKSLEAQNTTTNDGLAL